MRTIEEIRRLKAQAEADVLEILTKLHAKTSFRPTAIRLEVLDVTHIESVGQQAIVGRVLIEMEGV